MYKTIHLIQLFFSTKLKRLFCKYIFILSLTGLIVDRAKFETWFYKMETKLYTIHPCIHFVCSCNTKVSTVPPTLWMFIPTDTPLCFWKSTTFLSCLMPGLVLLLLLVIFILHLSSSSSTFICDTSPALRLYDHSSCHRNHYNTPINTNCNIIAIICVSLHSLSQSWFDWRRIEEGQHWENLKKEHV